MKGIQKSPKQGFLSYYYNKAIERGKEVAVTYKSFDLAPGSGVVDLELGRMDQLTYFEWITDTTVDDGQGWGYLKDTSYKSTTELVHYLIDNVSKNGYLLLNVGPKPDGTLPDEAKDLLLGMGKWLEVNGEAITVLPIGLHTAKDLQRSSAQEHSTKMKSRHTAGKMSALQ